MDVKRVHELLRQRAEAEIRLGQIPYDGSPEVKLRGDKRYLYMRKRVDGKLTSQYVGPYTPELHELLVLFSKECRALHKTQRSITKELASLGFEETGISKRVRDNMFFAQANVVTSIYDLANYVGINVKSAQVERILDNGHVGNVTSADARKILNMQNAFDFILSEDMLQCPTSFDLLCHIAMLVNEGIYEDGGRVRWFPLTMSGTTYVPLIPDEEQLRSRMTSILESGRSAIEVAIMLFVFCVQMQPFVDGNARTGVLIANHYLISHGQGVFAIPARFDDEFEEALSAHLEGHGTQELVALMKEKAWQKF